METFNFFPVFFPRLKIHICFRRSLLAKCYKKALLLSFTQTAEMQQECNGFA